MSERIGVGDYVRFRLPSGLGGRCLLIGMECSAENPENITFLGLMPAGGMGTVTLYQEDIIEILGVGKENQDS